MTNIVVSYTNPDLDGVACSMAIESLESGRFQARVHGNLDEETRVVLAALELPPPPEVISWDDLECIWLVDTHHVKQLPAQFPHEKVVRITDHHTAGDAQRFPNAEIQNEAVGAAASLVTELFLEKRVRISPKVALLLQAAILSNTIGFRAPATSRRDRKAFRVLQQVQAVSEQVIASMKEAKRLNMSRSTIEILRDDTKMFETGFGLVIIAQIESPGAFAILNRSDLVSSLTALSESSLSSGAVLNIVDTEESKSAVLSTVPQILSILSSRLEGSKMANGGIVLDRILQRKTDIVPHLERV